MYVSYGIHTLTTWLGHEEGRKRVAYKFKHIRCKIEHNRTLSNKNLSYYLHSDHILNFAKFCQPRPRSSFVPTISPVPIILIANLRAKSNQKPIK